LEIAFARGLIGPALRDDLERLAELRKVTAHYKPPLTPNTVRLRAYDRAAVSSAETAEDLLDEVVHGDARFALRVATELILGEEAMLRSMRLP
jgi:hypothetical protein